MKRIFLSLALVFGVALFLGCAKEKEEKKAEVTEEAAPAEQPAMPADHPSMNGEEAAGPHGAGEKPSREVVVPEEVQSKWQAVGLKVVDAEEGKEYSIDAKVGEATPVPGTDLSVTVEAFLPDYTIEVDTITTKSNEPNNPAILVALSKGEETLAEGWVFEKLADFNSYRHDRYSIELLTQK